MKSSLEGFLKNAARTSYFLDRLFSVVGFHIDGARGAHDEMNLKTLTYRIQSRCADTIVLREPADPNALDACFAKTF